MFSHGSEPLARDFAKFKRQRLPLHVGTRGGSGSPIDG
jgi:hypothetical protein